MVALASFAGHTLEIAHVCGFSRLPNDPERGQDSCLRFLLVIFHKQIQAPDILEFDECERNWGIREI